MRISKKKPDDNKNSITGLETAVVMIAFVVMAAIFVYSLLAV